MISLIKRVSMSVQLVVVLDNGYPIRRDMLLDPSSWELIKVYVKKFPMAWFKI